MLRVRSSELQAAAASAARRLASRRCGVRPCSSVAAAGAPPPPPPPPAAALGLFAAARGAAAPSSLWCASSRAPLSAPGVGAPPLGVPALVRLPPTSVGIDEGGDDAPPTTNLPSTTIECAVPKNRRSRINRRSRLRNRIAYKKNKHFISYYVCEGCGGAVASMHMCMTCMTMPPRRIDTKKDREAKRGFPVRV